MKEYLSDDSVGIAYLPKFREYGIKVIDGGSSFIEIKYCPWCGKKLKKSLRNKWFNEIEKIGLQPGDNNIPKKYLSSKWWKNHEK